MSFLVEENAHETLQEALAFIDACVDTSSNSGSSSTSSPLSLYDDLEAFLLERDDHPAVRPSAFTSETLLMGSSAKQKQQQQTKRNTKTPQSHLAAVKRNREKKKAETTLLREQVAQLEAKLKQLKLAKKAESSSLQVRLQRIQKRCSGGGDGDGEERGVFATGAGKQEYINPEDNDDELLVATVQPTSQVSLWQGMAAMQARERRKSQALNAELKDAVNHQMKVVESLQIMLLNSNGNQGGFVRDQQQQQHQQFLYTNALLNQGLGIMADLQRRAHHEFLEMDAIFRHSSWTEITDSVMFSSQSKFTPEGGGGPVMELRMSVPLHCNFRDAVDAVWRRATTASVLIDTPSYSLKIQHLTKTSYQKNYTIRIEGSDNSIIELEGIAHVQRFMGVDHDAYIWSCAVFLCSDKSEVFHEKGWVVASNCPAAGGNSDSATATLCRGFSQVSCDDPAYDDKAERDDEDHEVDTNWSSDARFRRMFIIKSLAHHTRGYHESTQNLLLSEFSGYQMR